MEKILRHAWCKMFWNCFRFLSYNRSTRTLIAATRARLAWASQGNLPFFARRPVVEARTTNCKWALIMNILKYTQTRRQVWVGFGLSSYSVIIQLYSDGTWSSRVQILTCCRAPTPWATRFLYRSKPAPPQKFSSALWQWLWKTWKFYSHIIISHLAFNSITRVE